jgi:hypothetical protein
MVNNIPTHRQLAMRLVRATRVQRLTATLGNGTEIRDRNRPGYVYVTMESADGTRYARSLRLKCVVQMQLGLRVLVGLDHDFEWAVMEVDVQGQAQQGFDPLSNNPADPNYGKPTQQDDLLTLKCYAISTPDYPSTKVVVKPFMFRRAGAWYMMPEQQIDLAPYIPVTANRQVLAYIFLDPTNTPPTYGVTTSDEIALVETFEIGDIQACEDNTGLDGQAIPVKFWRLYTGQSSITQDDERRDGRQLINVPEAGGGNDANAIHTNVSGEINGLTEKATPVSTDLIVVEDSAASYAKKKVQIGNLPSSGGGVTNVTASSPLASSGGTTPNISLDDSGATAATYSGPLSITVTAKGIISAISTTLLNLATQVSGLLSLAHGGTGADLSSTGPGFLKQTGSGSVVSVAALADSDIPDALTINGGTVENTPIGQTTPAAGYFSALRLKIGGFFAIFTHSNSADRTYTLPNYDATLATVAGTETLTNKTLTTPTIGDFTNANHNHQNAAGGGTLDGAAIASGTVAAARLGVMTGDSGSGGAKGAAPAPAAGDAAAGKFLKADGTWTVPAGMPDIYWFGDGSDGDATISGALSLTRDMYYNNLTIQSGAIITTNGWSIFVKGTLDVTAAPAGWLKNTGNDATGTTAATGTKSGSVAGTVGGGTSSASANTTGGFGTAGEAGGAGGSGGRAVSLGQGATNPTGNRMGRITQFLHKAGSAILGGSGGGAGTTGSLGNAAGGGGGGGGVIYLAANTISRGGSTAANGIQANGGNGGNGSASVQTNGAGGGGGGGGGWVYLIYKTLSGSVATNFIQAAGGNGGNGSNGSTRGGGGGEGGAGGRITLVNVSSMTISESTGGAGSAGGTESFGTGGTGGAGNNFRVSL